MNLCNKISLFVSPYVPIDPDIPFPAKILFLRNLIRIFLDPIRILSFITPQSTLAYDRTSKRLIYETGVNRNMGMPVITPGTATRTQAITDVIESVALEETALSHILNAEGEKIQKMVAMQDATPEILLATNKSVESMVNAVSRLEMILQSKLSVFDGCLCDNTDTAVE